MNWIFELITMAVYGHAKLVKFDCHPYSILKSHLSNDKIIFRYVDSSILAGEKHAQNRWIDATKGFLNSA